VHSDLLKQGLVASQRSKKLICHWMRHKIPVPMKLQTAVWAGMQSPLASPGEGVFPPSHRSLDFKGQDKFFAMGKRM